MIDMNKRDNLKKKRKIKLFRSIFVIFIAILIAIQVKDKLSPATKKSVLAEPSSNNSDYVIEDNEYNEDKEDDLLSDEKNIDVEVNEKDNEDYIEQEKLEKKKYLEETVYIDDEGKKVVNNLDDILILVNKERNLPSDYKPSDLVIPNVRFSFEGEDQKKYMRKEAALALEELFREGEKEEIILYAVSGYRSYARQEILFNNRVERDGVEEANKLVARPGQSEHQTGLAMDVSSKSVLLSLDEDFGETKEGIWLKENAHRFGFIIRYLKDKENITGYSYEPWHVRYVGKDTAKEIYEKGITLEEYLGFEYAENNE